MNMYPLPCLIHTGLEKRREYEKNAKSSRLVNQLQHKHTLADVTSGKYILQQLKQELRLERSRRSVSSLQHTAPH